MNTAHKIPAMITRKFPVISIVFNDSKSKFVVINTTPRRLNSTPATFLPLTCSFKIIGLSKPTHTTLRLTKSDDAKATNLHTNYCSKGGDVMRGMKALKVFVLMCSVVLMSISSAPAQQMETIDIMIVYTPAAKAWVGRDPSFWRF